MSSCLMMFLLLQTAKITYEQMQNYQISVIEREVQQGILKVSW